MKYIIFLFLILTNDLMAQKSKQEYIQPMSPPRNEGFLDLRHNDGGAILLNGKSKINLSGQASEDPNSSIFRDLQGVVNKVDKNKEELDSLTNAHDNHVRSSSRSINVFDNDSILRDLKKNKKDGLKIQIKNISIDEAKKISASAKKDILFSKLSNYINFNEKKHIGTFSGVTVNPVKALDNYDLHEESTTINVPKHKSNLYLQGDMKNGRIFTDIRIEEGNYQGRVLYLTNNTNAYLGFKIGCQDCIAPKVGGNSIGGVFYIEPAKTLMLIFNHTWWNRIGGYYGLSKIPDQIPYIRETNTCQANNGGLCEVICPKNSEIISGSCRIDEVDDLKLLGSGLYTPDLKLQYWRCRYTSKYNTRGNINVNAICKLPILYE